MALALILFCVYQVMLAATTAAPLRSNSDNPFSRDIQPTSGHKHLPIITDGLDIELNQTKHEKRSLAADPFGERYMCNNERCLMISDEGKVGTIQTPNASAAMVLINARAHVSNTSKHEPVFIQSKRNAYYICMNAKGKVYATKIASDECHWIQISKPNGKAYQHEKFSGKRPTSKNPFGGQRSDRRQPWFLAINKKKGKIAKGYRKKSKNFVFLEIAVKRQIIQGQEFGRTNISYTESSTGSTDPNGSITSTSSSVTRPGSGPEITTKKPRRCNKKPRRCRPPKNRGKGRRKKKVAKKDLSPEDDPLSFFRSHGVASTSQQREVLSKRDMGGDGGLFQTLRQSNSRHDSSESRTANFNLFSSVT